jgi:hypothetical protein
LRIRYRKRDSLPKLAWCARLRAGGDFIRVEHGPWVETREDQFFEGAWNGPFARGRPDEATVSIGSGARLVEPGIVFASPTNKIERLFWLRTESELLVSNSLLFVLTRAGDELDPTHPYYLTDQFRSVQSAADAPKSIHARSGRRVNFLEYGNLLVTPELSVSRLEKAEPAPPGDYVTYVSQLRREIAALLDNAASPERLRPYRPLTLLSQGYDSPAVAVLVRDAGGREVATFSRAEGEPTRDDGLAIAEALGLECTDYDRSAYKERPGVPEAEFCAAGYAGSQVPFAALEEQLRGSVLCTGHGGDRVWCRASPDETVAGPGLSLPDAPSLGGASLNEFRLRVGFLYFPVPYSHMIHSAAIHAISRSREMEPWSIGGNYDRPIQRRLVEEAGVPRRMFGQSKQGFGHFWISEIGRMTATSRADYRAFYVALRRRTPRLRWLRARAGHVLDKLHYKAIRFLTRRRLLAFGTGPRPTSSYHRLDIRRPWALHFTMHWGQERIRHRYLEAEPGQHAGGHHYRTGVLATRSLVEGEAACVAALERAPDLDAEAFAFFAHAQNLREWFTPLVDSERARSLLSGPFLAQLEKDRAAQPRLKQALLELCGQIRTALDEARIPCLFLKGLYVGERFYGDVHRRHQYDVDVLVRPADFEAALQALALLGFDVTTGASGKPLARRLRKIRTRGRERAPQTVTVRREDGLKLDLHCRLKSRWFHGIDEGAAWADRRTFTVGGREFETLSDEHTLLFLIVSLCFDLRRGACRAKHFLDLYLVLRTLGPGLDWERFLAKRQREGLLKVSVNVLAVFLTLWDCAEEFPELAVAIERRRHRLEIHDARDALALATRPRRNHENRIWFERLCPGPPLACWRWRLTSDLPHTLRRAWARTRGDAGEVPWRRAPGAKTGLPPALAALLESEALEASHSEEITPLPGGTTPRRTFRIELADGRVVKGRIVRDAATASRMQRWLPMLPEASFPRLLATRGAATLEAWCSGSPCRAVDDSTLETSGALLGEVHGLIGREEVSSNDARLIGWFEDIECWIEELRRAGTLSDGFAGRVLERTAETRPAQATWGLRHGDFCAENLVIGDRGLCCIDNATVAPGILESDLAQTFYRWPMTTRERESFLRGYRRHAAPEMFREHEGFWMVAAALRAVAIRRRGGTGALEAPLRVLERHVA